VRPPPRIWWDGEDFLVLAPPPRIDSRGRSTMPSAYPVDAVEDLASYGGPMVELVPVQPVPGLDDGQVIASVEITMPRRRAPRWWRRLVCLAQGHNLIGVDLPEGWSVQACRTCDAQVHGYRPGATT